MCQRRGWIEPHVLLGLSVVVLTETWSVRNGVALDGMADETHAVIPFHTGINHSPETLNHHL